MFEEIMETKQCFTKRKKYYSDLLYRVHLTTIYSMSSIIVNSYNDKIDAMFYDDVPWWRSKMCNNADN